MLYKICWKKIARVCRHAIRLAIPVSVVTSIIMNAAIVPLMSKSSARQVDKTIDLTRAVGGPMTRLDTHKVLRSGGGYTLVWRVTSYPIITNHEPAIYAPSLDEAMALAKLKSRDCDIIECAGWPFRAFCVEWTCVGVGVFKNNAVWSSADGKADPRQGIRVPWSPMWLGLAIDTLLVFVVVYTASLGFSLANLFRRQRNGLCSACGYPLAGPVCSECGVAHIAQ